MYCNYLVIVLYILMNIIIINDPIYTLHVVLLLRSIEYFKLY